MVDTYDDRIDYYSQKNNVDPQLTKTILHLESSGGINSKPSIPTDPDSPTGPMQIRPSVARRLGITDPNNLNQALDAGTKYLREGLDAAKERGANPNQLAPNAMAYYFGGSDRSQWGPKTDAYVQKGMSTYGTMTLTKTQDDMKHKPVDDKAGADYMQQLMTGKKSPVNPGSAYMEKMISGQSSGTDNSDAVNPGAAYMQKLVDDNKSSNQTDQSTQQPSTIESFGQGLVHGFTGVGDMIGTGLNKLAGAADQKFPGLAKIDQYYGLDPAANLASHNKLSAAREADYQSRFGDSMASKVGDFTGQTVATLPFTGPIGKVGATLGTKAAESYANPVIQNIIKGAGDIATGATQGATAAGLTGGDMKEGAAAGGVVSGLGIGAGLASGPITKLVQNKIADALVTGLSGYAAYRYGYAGEAALGFFVKNQIGPVLHDITRTYGPKVADLVARSLNGTVASSAAGVVAGQLQPANKLSQYVSPLENAQD